MVQTRRATAQRAAGRSEHEQKLGSLAAADINILLQPPHEGEEVKARSTKRARKERLPNEPESSVAVTRLEERGIDTDADTDTGTAADEPTLTKPPRRSRTGTRKEAPLPKPSDFAPRVSSPWKIGAHVSAQGGVENTIVNAARVRANAFALFVKSQRRWTSPPLTDENIATFKARMNEFGYDSKHILPHGSYLINLGNPDDQKREKSYECFIDDLRRCEQLGLTLYNFHPGSTVGRATKDESIALIAQCLNKAHHETSSIIIVLENMAGAKNIIGSQFTDLRSIIDLVEDKSRVGVCLDTCHLFAAGYDISRPTHDNWMRGPVAAFDEQVGLSYLRGMHFNDAKMPLGSGKDRHENIGLGTLTLSTFSTLLADPRIQNIPLILETPMFDAMEVWEAEIGVLNSLAEAGMGVEGGMGGGSDSKEVTGEDDNEGGENDDGKGGRGERKEDTDRKEMLREMVDVIRSVVREHRDVKGERRKTSSGGKSESKSKKRKKSGGGGEEVEGDPHDSDCCAEDPQ
ncbi:AP endonuclease [Paxillus ammoniavirescens]|nr:AP endonuclease [Paxillus ammoniavirescens]